MNPYGCESSHEKGEPCVISLGAAIYHGAFFFLQAILFVVHFMYLLFLWIDNGWTLQAFIQRIIGGEK